MRTHYDFYGYNSPTDGTYNIGGTDYFCGEDFRSKKRYREYKNLGLNILLLQHKNSYSGELPFENSACYKCMSEAAKAGIKKIIVSDTRIKDLCIEPTLIGENGKFKTEKELLDYLAFCIAPYKDMQGFIGVQMFDEPRWFHLKSYGAVFKGLKKILPDIYLQCNLNPIAPAEITAENCSDDYVAYERYLNTFLDETGADSITFDEYPFRRDYLICGNSILSYQIASKVCKERGVELRAVFQTFSCLYEGRLVHRRVTESDMYWSINLGLGFGCREYGFFTYFTKQNVVLKGGFTGDSVDGAAIINRDGSRTALYGIVKKIIKELKGFYNVASKYEYEDNWVVLENGKKATDYPQTEFAVCKSNSPFGFSISRDVLLVTKSAGKDSDLYMALNASNLKDEYFGNAVYTVSADLPEGTEIWYRGKKTGVVGKEKFSANVKVGDALFFKVKK